MKLKALKYISVFLFCGLIFFSNSLKAFEIPAIHSYVNDFAYLLNAQEKQNLESYLQEIEKQSSVQIVLATFTSLQGESLEDLSHKMATQWQIGQKEKNNGVLLLIFSEDRKLRIEVGYGLESVLTDALCKRIITNEITPFFKQGQYAAGIQSGFESIRLAIKGEYKFTESNTKEASGLLDKIFLAFIISIIIFSRLSNSRRTYSSSGWRSGGWGGGFGGSRGGGGGGFSGGGGSFGGGGASGRW